MLIIILEGTPLAPFREVLMDIEADSALLAQDDGIVAGDAAVSPVGAAVGQAASWPKQARLWQILKLPPSIDLCCCRGWCPIGGHMGVWDGLVHCSTKLTRLTLKVCPCLVLTCTAPRAIAPNGLGPVA